MNLKLIIDKQLCAQSEASMLSRITGAISTAKLYEDPSYIQAAREVIPIAILNDKAEKSLQNSKIDLENNPPEVIEPIKDFRDYLLLELLTWFKHQFFSWVHSAPCELCKGDTSNRGGDRPNQEEQRHMAGVVELYHCSKCNHITRFPRYNCPKKLLSTRRGRCGEWTNCFTLIARAMGYDVRSTHDWTDHVWTEVYCDSLKEWIHCDPCEATRDVPWLYESGWGKKLNYIISISAYEVVDVSRRYTADFTKLLLPRRRVFIIFIIFYYIFSCALRNFLKIL